MTDPVRPSSVFFHPRYHCCIYYCFLINDTNKTSIYLLKTLKCCELSLFKKINLTKHTHTHLQKNILPNTRSAPHLSTTNASATKSSRSFSWQKWIQQTKLILLIAIAIFFVLSCCTTTVTVASSIPQFLGCQLVSEHHVFGLFLLKLFWRPEEKRPATTPSIFLNLHILQSDILHKYLTNILTKRHKYFF